MKKQTLSFIVLIAIFLPASGVVAATSVNHWKWDGTHWYSYENSEWDVMRDDDGGIVVIDRPIIIVYGKRVPVPDTGVLTRLSGFRGTFYMWNGYNIAEPDGPDDEEEDPGDGTSGGGETPTTKKPDKPKPKHTIEITLDADLRSGYFLSTDTQHRIRASTKAPASDISWGHSGKGSSGSLQFHPQTGSKVTRITFSLPTKTKSNTGSPLSYTVSGKLPNVSHSRSFEQDRTSALQQQYIDLKCKRWGYRHVPARGVFKTSYNTGRYVTADYNGGSTPFLMFLGWPAEKIRMSEENTTGHAPRITSGYRQPKHPANTDSTLHQYGLALDMNPASAINSISNRKAMCARVKQLYRNSRYDVVCHGSGNNYHTHIEYDP